jgi:uncharacterized protein YcbX
MAGEAVDALALFERGAEGDRRCALSWRDGQQLTARAASRMLAWSAVTKGDEILVSDPNGRVWGWGEPGLVDAISRDLGREVGLLEDPTLMQDLPDSVLVTFQATLDGLSAELRHPVDLRRFRTNLHVVLDADPFAEAGWEGRRLVVGAAELELLHPCKRCVIVTRDPDTQEAWGALLKHIHAQHGSIFGINARPLGHAIVRVGDRVTLRR